ncbi:MAG TPA: preprotein translocase subunit SecY, partial [Chloroflexota bacterium]|nr:preprotein translocase subunit SecY [Chloroflexota bacterium]
MFGSLKNMFRIPDLRNKILFTLLVILLYRLGSNITVPGIDFNAVQDLQRQAERGGVLGFLNLFSGGALTQMAVFALGIMPYITSSIIMQLLAVVIPRIEQWQKQGAVGQRKITQWTRYMTVGLAILQATGITYQFNNGLLGSTGGSSLQLVRNFDVPHVSLIVLTITAGTAVVMWMGELITQRGIGNGMSLLIFANVVSRLPAQIGNVRAEGGNVIFTVVIAVGLLMIALYRLGANITVPGIDFQQVQRLQNEAARGGVLGFLNLFSGGALTQMAVFALGIMPYITSSIIMQLLAVVIPRIEQWQKQGAVGQKKITQWTRYMTVGLAVLQATGITYQFNNGLLAEGTDTGIPLVTT